MENGDFKLWHWLILLLVQGVHIAFLIYSLSLVQILIKKLNQVLLLV
jgi:hypothetical protein